MPARTRPSSPLGSVCASIQGIATMPMSSRHARACRRSASASGPSAERELLEPVDARQDRGDLAALEPRRRSPAAARPRASRVPPAARRGRRAGAHWRPRRTRAPRCPTPSGSRRGRGTARWSAGIRASTCACRWPRRSRIATDCHTVISAIHSRTCQTTKPGPRPASANGFVPAPCRCSLTAALIPLQPGRAQADDRHDERAGGQEHVLQVVREQQRHHPADCRVGEREQEQRGHRPGDVARVDAGEDRQEARLDQREDAEVQRAADRHQHAGRARGRRGCSGARSTRAPSSRAPRAAG